MEGKRKYLYAREKGRTREKETSSSFCPLSSISHINPFPKKCVISHKGRELFTKSIIFPHPPTQKMPLFFFWYFLLLLNIMEGGVQTHIHLERVEASSQFKQIALFAFGKSLAVGGGGNCVFCGRDREKKREIKVC